MTPTSTSSTTDDPGRDAGTPASVEGLLEVGRVGKAHGLTGEVVVALVSNRPERVVVGSTFLTDDGELRIEASRPFADNWLMTFAGVDSRERAEALRGTVLRGRPLEDDDAWWVHELIGSEVLDTAGVRLGTVAGVLANPASDLLELDGGALVPLRFVVERSAGRVVVEVPAGLLDLSGREGGP